MGRRRKFETPRRIGWALRLDPSELACFHATARAKGTTLAEMFRAVMAVEAIANGVQLPNLPPKRSAKAASQAV